MPDVEEPRRSFTRHFRNWTSWIGLLLAGSALFAFLFLFAVDLVAKHPNAYIGILAYLVAPAFFFLGSIIAIVGALLQRRRERRAQHESLPLEIHIDLSRPRDRRILAVFAAGSVAFLFVTAFGSYETSPSPESVEFCGKACHVPMKPEFVASQSGPHARVVCVECHVGPGAA